MTTALACRPATSLVAAASGERLPTYVTREQGRAIINTATSQTHRLLLECLWQSGGRLSEVLRLCPCDVDVTEGALVLDNRKQMRGSRKKRVYVSATWSPSSATSLAMGTSATATPTSARPRAACAP